MANFINAIKNVVVTKVNEVSTVIRQTRNIIQAATAASTLNLTTDMVIAVALDEAKKYTSYGVEFRTITNDDDEFINRIQAWREFSEQNLNRRLGILTHFNQVKEFSKAAAKSSALKTATQICGETLTIEHDGKDAVYIYVDVLKSIWFMLSKEGEDWQEIVRQIVRHEFRHMRQFLELRKRGYNGYVLLVYETDISEIDYNNRITELDAWGNQAREPKDQDPIEPVINALIAKFRRVA